MAKCKICGKKGLFLVVNSMEMCNTCNLEYEQKKAEELQKQKAAAKDYYNQILTMYSDFEAELDLDDDIISRLSLIPDINNKIQLGYDLLLLLKEIDNYSYLEEFIINDITYRNDSDKRIGFGSIDKLSMRIWIKNNTISLEKFSSDLSTTIKKMMDIWRSHIYKIEHHADFQRKLLSIENYNINIIDSKVDESLIDEMPELKFSTISSKTDYSKLGTFVSLDIETTGLNPKKDEIIEIGAILFIDWIPHKKFETLLNPKDKIPYNITQITGISSEMVKTSPTFLQVISSLNDFISSYNIVGHNLEFDIEFLYYNGFDIFANKRKYYDTLNISRKTLKVAKKKWDKDIEAYNINYDCDFDVMNYKLDTLCDYYQIRDNTSSHRALSDCLATGILFQKLAQEKLI